MHRFVSRAVAAAAVCALTFGLGGCTASGPMGLRRDGGDLVIVLGRQCAPASYLTGLRVWDTDDGRDAAVRPPVWEIEAEQARALPEVIVGTVPDGYTAKTDHLAAQGLSGRVSMLAIFGDTSYGTTIDTGRIRDGAVLTAGGSLMSRAGFRAKYGC
jgi:hypothetical protein